MTDQTGTVSVRNFTLQLNGKNYDHLSLKAAVPIPNHREKVLFFQGKSLSRNKWRFSVPDSIIEFSEFFGIITQPFDFKTNTYYCAKFKNPFAEDRNRYTYIYDDSNPDIKASFIQTYKAHDKLGDGFYFVVNDTFTTDGISRVEDIYDVQFNRERETELELSMKYPNFCFLETNNYKTSIAMRDSIIKEYPNSKYLMNQFYRLYGQLKIDDAKSMFINFSEKNRNSGFGKIICDYLKLYSSPFENTLLINTETGVPEQIIRDSTRINLVIFSASWCKPCHKLIPVLKEIYNDLHPDLEMVYVSMDEYNYVNEWKKLIHDYKIPWRSTSAHGHIKEIENKYDAGGLPHMLLILPNRTVKKIDIRIDQDKEEIYRMVKEARKKI